MREESISPEYLVFCFGKLAMAPFSTRADSAASICTETWPHSTRSVSIVARKCLRYNQQVCSPYPGFWNCTGLDRPEKQSRTLSGQPATDKWKVVLILGDVMTGVVPHSRRTLTGAEPKLALSQTLGFGDGPDSRPAIATVARCLCPVCVIARELLLGHVFLWYVVQCWDVGLNNTRCAVVSEDTKNTAADHLTSWRRLRVGHALSRVSNTTLT